MDWAAIRRFTVDNTLVVVAAALGILREVSDPNHATKLVVAPVGVYVVLQAVAAAALWWRRSRPFTAALVIGVVSLFAPATAAFVIPYAVTRYGVRRWLCWPVLAALTIAWLIGAHAWAIDDPFTGPFVITVATLLGLYVRARRRLVEELVERADRAERERDLRAERARADERARLAAEMHDVVTHRINLMVLQAGALEVASAEPQVQKASRDIREAGVQALEEMRDLVGVLRSGTASPGDDVAPEGEVPQQRPAQETHADTDGTSLAGLVSDSQAVGLEVDLRERGEQVAAPTVRRALYRVVQESLTNVHKHAPGSSVSIEVVYAAHQIVVDVRNTAPARPPDLDLTGTGGGNGLAGLAQRIEMLGGRISAAPCSDGGFAVNARLPAFVPTGDRG